jgi:hypothetical protein
MYEPHFLNPTHIPSGSRRNSHREERPARSSSEGAGAIRSIPEKTTGLHAEFVPTSPETSIPLTRAELQGHAIKNKDLLAASGAITLKGADSLDELQEDEQAVGPFT